MAEEDALELVLPCIGGKLPYAVRQSQLPAPETSSDQPPMSSLPRSEGDSGEFYSRITSHASSDELEPLSREAMGTRKIGLSMAASSISFLERDSASLVLLPETVSKAPWHQKRSNPLSDGREGLPSGVENIRSHIVEIADDMKNEFPCQLEKIRVQAEMIYRVPQINHSLDGDAYTPQFVSFGPYHRGIEALRSADKYKWFSLQQILNMNKKIPLEKYLEEMDQQKVKDCYEEDIQNVEIKMLLLDGCCILRFLDILPLRKHQTQKQDDFGVEASTVWKYIPRISCPRICCLGLSRMAASELAFDAIESQKASTVKGESKRTADSAIITLWHHDSIRHDLLLMENQLPFFVLEKIYDLATERTVTASHTLIKEVDEKINKLLKSYPLRTTEQSFHHLLHCCHLKFKPDMTNNPPSNSKSEDELERKWRTATDLYKAGIKFKPKLPDPNLTLLDVKLVSRRTLMIPTLKIEDSTNSVFRNLIAFEQSCTHENYFTAYAFFMGELMSKPEDVTLLVRKGVVKNYIGADKEVSDFFNNLVKGVVFNVNGKHYLRSTFEDLNSYCNSEGHKFLADLKLNYCGSPWLVISLIAAAVVLVCTVVQTVFAVIG